MNFVWNSLRFFSVVLLLAFCLVKSQVYCAEQSFSLDRFPVKRLNDQAALQRGVKLFVNYCQGCHGAASMRYNRLSEIGLTQEQIQKNLIFTGAKPGDLMRTAMRTQDAKLWFGVAPPDLSVIARARASEEGSGADWLYTYLRSFFRDETTPTGWNNALFEKVAMPHVMWSLQGPRKASLEEVREAFDANGVLSGIQKITTSFDSEGFKSKKVESLPLGDHVVHLGRHWTFEDSDPQASGKYDDTVADLVAYLTYMSDPTAKLRFRIGVATVLFLSVFACLCWWLNRTYWKDIK